jgi:hypothetical protein
MDCIKSFGHLKFVFYEVRDLGFVIFSFNCNVPNPHFMCVSKLERLVQLAQRDQILQSN